MPDAAAAPIPGPADREGFLAQQRTYRRRIWELEALCAFAVLLMGIPLSVVVSPIVWSAAVLGVDLVNLLTPVPNLGAAVFRMLDQTLGAHAAVPARAVVTLTAALLAPGIAAIGLAWGGLRVVLRRSGIGAVVTALGARPPHADDLEEHRVTNVVEEMSIAAGVTPPRVMVLDTAAMNAGAVGVDHREAVVIVSRGLIDSLDRDETQAVVGHVIASIGNGDVRGSLTMLGVANALGLITLLLGGPFSRRTREGMRDWLRLALHRRGQAGDNADRLRAMLAAGDDEVDSDGPAPSRRARLRDVLGLPFVTAQAAFWMNRTIFLSLLAGPAIAWLWRARRYYADAAAVQLTRYPDALARALAHLAEQNNALPGSARSGHLFIVGRNATGGLGRAAADQPIDSFVSFDPPISKRIDHLRAAGATFSLPDSPKPRSRAGLWLLLAIGAPLLALFTLVMGAAALALVYVSLAIDMLFLLPVVGLLHLALQSAPSWVGR